MKRLLWSILLISGYIWSTATGRDQFVYDQGKRLYTLLTAWFEDAEIDFQVEKEPPPVVKKKKRPRRWD